MLIFYMNSQPNFSANDNLLIEALYNMHANNTRIVESLISQNNDIRADIANFGNRRQRFRRENNVNERFQNDVRNELINMLYRNSSRISQHDNSNSSFETTNTFILHDFLNDVNVFPTREQISAASRNVRYGDIIRPINTSCPISLDSFNDDSRVTMIRHCGHIFNTTDFNSWFSMNCKCPVCRYDIRNIVTA